MMNIYDVHCSYSGLCGPNVYTDETFIYYKCLYHYTHLLIVLKGYPHVLELCVVVPFMVSLSEIISSWCFKY